MPAPGVRLTVLVGDNKPSAVPPTPLPAELTARLLSATVTESDTDQSMFTLTFEAGRSPRGGAVDVPGLTRLSDFPLGPMRRIVVEVCLGASAVVLIDGVVTQVQLTPGSGPGTATLAVTGEDLSFWLDQKEYIAGRPQENDAAVVQSILDPWKVCGIGAAPTDTPASDPNSQNEAIPTQRGSDLAHLRELAARHGFVTYLIPGPARGRSTFYWGPPQRDAQPQPPLSVDRGAESTISDLSFDTQMLPALTTRGLTMDRRSCRPIEIAADAPTPRGLSAQPLWSALSGGIRQRLPQDGVSDGVLAQARAQAEVDRSQDGVRASGVVDGARYGQPLRARGLVPIRGAGLSHDGLWYVKEVEHHLARGLYRQHVRLTRDGWGSTVPSVASLAAL